MKLYCLHQTANAGMQASTPTTQQNYSFNDGTGVAVININGGLEAESYGEISEALANAVASPNMRAIVLAISSPGGEASGATDLGDQIAAAKQVKPIYSMISGIGASAGYWLASQATKVFASRGTFVGGIGVYSILVDASEAATQQGLHVHLVRAGEFKGTGVLGTPITNVQLEDLKEFRLTEASIARHLRHLKAICRWAHRQGIILSVPTFDMPKRASGATRMKGRPITTEEFERMLQVTPDVVGEAAAASWKLFMRVLWASGLRVGEALSLRWDDKSGCVTVRLDGKRSILVFDADSQKSGKVELVPLAPEAVMLLEPLKRARGYVFNLLGTNGQALLRRSYLASKYVSRIGEKAGVIVDSERGKFASAHDLRRAFGQRWSRQVMPAVLKELMRHSSIETTMTYYVGQNAQTTAAELWKVSGDILGGAEPLAPSGDSVDARKNPAKAGS